MTKVSNPLDKSEVNLQENEELVDLLTELDNKPEEESKAADNNQETAETEEVAEATE